MKNIEKKIRSDIKKSLSVESEEQNDSDDDPKKGNYQNHKKMLHELKSKIESDSKKLENAVNIYEEVSNNTDFADPNKSTNDYYPENNSTKTKDEKSNSTIDISSNEQIKTLDPLNTSTSGNDTTQVFGKLNYTTEGAPDEYFDELPILIDEEIDDESEEFQGEHHAFKGSSSMLKNEHSLFVFAITFIIIGQFVN